MTVFEGERLGPGEYEVRLNSTDFISGIYFYELMVNGKSVTKKMTVLK